MKPFFILSYYFLTWSCSVCFVGAGVALAEPNRQRPNILVILADDLGYGDVRCNNPDRSKIATPNFDRIAQEGMRFTDGHSSSGCCSPSRYTLLTGRYHWRTRLQQGIVGVWGKPLIAPDRMTIATLAKQHGYQTAAIGKWHLGRDWPIADSDREAFRDFKDDESQVTPEMRAAWQRTFSQSIPGGPTTRGFDLYFGTDVPNWPPYCFIENDRTVGTPTRLLDTKLLVSRNIASLQGPALEEWKLEGILPALTDRACNYILEASARPEPYLLYLPLTTPHTPLTPNAPWQGKSGLNNACADLIMETDAMVGRVLDAVKQSGEADNTFVLFTSDNGFASYVGVKELEQQGHFPSGPLRGYKADAFEGGHRVAFMVRWPGIVKEGTVSHHLVHQADIMATLAEILGAKLPDSAGEDSFSFLATLRGDDRPHRDHAISTSCNGIPTLRDGNWKYIAAADPRDQGQGPEVQLYDLGNDLAESKNLAASMPEKVAEMKKRLEALIVAGRTTPGPKQKNDIRVIRYPKPPANKAAKQPAAK